MLYRTSSVIVQASGAFQPWGPPVKDVVCWHDPMIKALTEDFVIMWIVDTRLTSQAIADICGKQGVDLEPGQALHMVISAFLDGEAKIFVETAEVMNDHGRGTSKSGLELWRLLKYNYDRASAFNFVP